MNKASVEAIADKVGSLPWNEPDLVQLFVKDQGQGYFRVWMIIDGRMTQLVPKVVSTWDDGP